MIKFDSVDTDFSFYSETVGTMLSNFNRGSISSSSLEVSSLLRGAPSKMLFDSVSKETIRKSGIFFTSSKTSKMLAKIVSEDISAGGTVLDPTCGAGDLLLAATQYLCKSGSLGETMESWGKRLYGFDIFKTFVNLCIQRLSLKASLLQNDITDFNLDNLRGYFPNLNQGDFLSVSNHCYSKVSNVLMNPPYCYVESPPKITWANGKVTAASLFLSHVLSNVNANTRITALLPDVLRCGSRYEKWRSAISEVATIKKIKILGQFSDHADIHVFILDLIKRTPKRKKCVWISSNKKGTTIRDKFSISVGPVVQYRDEKGTGLYPFLTAKNTMAWKEMRSFSDRSSFKCRVIEGPFVIVKRTSRPGDKNRAVPTVIARKMRFLVDNHLIVAKPLKGGLSACRELMKSLKKKKVNVFLNQRARCRHLTVGVVADIPFKGD